jgi:hypothetical protein
MPTLNQQTLPRQRHSRRQRGAPRAPQEQGALVAGLQQQSLKTPVPCASCGEPRHIPRED